MKPPKMEEIKRNTFSNKVLFTFGIVVVGVIAIWLVTAAAQVFLLLFAGILVASLWMAVSRWLERKAKMKYSLSLTIIILITFAVIIGFFWFVGPQLAKQIDQLLQKLPDSFKAIKQQIGNYKWTNEVLSILPDQQQLLQNPGKILQNFLQFFSSFLGIILDIIIILVLAIFIASNPKWYHKGILVLFPKDKRGRISHTLNAVSYTLGAWFIARIIDMIIIGILTAIGLWALGMPLVLTLALLTAALNFIPNLGPILAAIPAILVAFTQSPRMALYVAILYLVVQALEGYLITPKIQKKAIQMPPAVLLTALLLLAALTGGWGLILAVPLTAMFMIIIKMLYVEDGLDTDLQISGEEKTGTPN